jgi:hypothetical protein
MEKFIPIEEYDGAWYFLGVGDDEPYVAAEDLVYIKPLTKEYSRQLWCKYVSSRGRHLMLLHERDWPRRKRLIHKFRVSTSPVADEEEQLYFVEKLCEWIELQPTEKVIFFWEKSSGIQTTWSMFLRYWTCYMFDDEGCILIIPSTTKAVTISNDGVFIEFRTKRCSINRSRFRNSRWGRIYKYRIYGSIPQQFRLFVKIDCPLHTKAQPREYFIHEHYVCKRKFGEGQEIVRLG